MGLVELALVIWVVQLALELVLALQVSYLVFEATIAVLQIGLVIEAVDGEFGRVRVPSLLVDVVVADVLRYELLDRRLRVQQARDLAGVYLGPELGKNLVVTVT